jgi:hypothetical protein
MAATEGVGLLGHPACGIELESDLVAIAIDLGGEIATGIPLDPGESMRRILFADHAADVRRRKRTWFYQNRRRCRKEF